MTTKTVKYCPKCHTVLNDNRLAKKQGNLSPRFPDFKCPKCGYAYWVNSKKTNTTSSVPSKSQSQVKISQILSSQNQTLQEIKSLLEQIRDYLISLNDTKTNIENEIENPESNDINQTSEENIEDIDIEDLDL